MKKFSFLLVLATLMMGLAWTLVGYADSGFGTPKPAASASAGAKAPAPASTPASAKRSSPAPVTTADICVAIIAASKDCAPGKTPAAAKAAVAKVAAVVASASAAPPPPKPSPAPKPVASAPSASASTVVTAIAPPPPPPPAKKEEWKGVGPMVQPEQAKSPSDFSCKDAQYMPVLGVTPHTVVCVLVSKVEAAQAVFASSDWLADVDDEVAASPKDTAKREAAKKRVKDALFDARLAFKGLEGTALDGLLKKHVDVLKAHEDRLTALETGLAGVRNDTRAIANGSCDVEDVTRVTPSELTERCREARQRNAVEFTPGFEFWGGGTPGFRAGPGLRANLVLGHGRVVALLGAHYAFLQGYTTGPVHAAGAHGGARFWSDSRRFSADLLGNVYAFSTAHGGNYRGIPSSPGFGYAATAGLGFNARIDSWLAFSVLGEFGGGDLNWYAVDPTRVDRGPVPIYKGTFGLSGSLPF